MEGLCIDLNNYGLEFLSWPAVMETFVDILVCAVPIWVAVMIGVLIGWSWRPRWSGLVFLGFRSKLQFVWTAPPGLGARRLWLALTALSALSFCRRLWFSFNVRSRKMDDSPAQELTDSATARQLDAVDFSCGGDIKPVEGASDGLVNSVTKNDLEHFLDLLGSKDGKLAWQSMMERSTSNLTYQAWCHEPEMGPIMYCSKTIYEDATPDLVRDFFWDDQFRPKWDPMLTHVEILEECPDTGLMIVHWIKKFPFFCSDREYIIGRRIWEVGKTYYCVTKGVPYPTLPRRDKPRRVDLYFSSWAIKPVQSRKGDGQLPACEVMLIHYEDMGIPKDVAKLGVRHGMWGTVKKFHAGFRAYQTARKLEASLSRCALMARITTKLSSNEEIEPRELLSGEEEAMDVVTTQKERDEGRIDWKWLAIGGAVALVCGLKTGLIGKTLVIGAGHRVGRRRARPRF
ncbi:Polyketide cyclase/dehydrase and lipid transport superfamily protein [Perilla frutescens var. frutescens]|nr:Polyketide cyclase/dehydrase and lipid transport superfamily protein [Perilla frutescens var. frutescens]